MTQSPFFRSRDVALRLERTMSSPVAPTWDGAVWIGHAKVPRGIKLPPRPIV